MLVSFLHYLLHANSFERRIQSHFTKEHTKFATCQECDHSHTLGGVKAVLHHFIIYNFIYYIYTSPIPKTLGLKAAYRLSVPTIPLALVLCHWFRSQSAHVCAQGPLHLGQQQWCTRVREILSTLNPLTSPHAGSSG